MNADFGSVNIIVSRQEAEKIWEKIDGIDEKDEMQDIEIDNKVDKVEGKGLSTNDYTTAEKEKLSGIEDGAEVNVQADWDETSPEKDEFIDNKPSGLTSSEIQDIVDSLS